MFLYTIDSVNSRENVSSRKAVLSIALIYKWASCILPGVNILYKFKIFNVVMN
jgi:hypothetical protein